MMRKLMIITILLFGFLDGNAQAKEDLISKDSLDKIFSGLIDANGPGTGILILGNSNKVLYKAGFGYADIEHKRKADANTQFNIGSISKSFTALAVMQLVEKGKLSVSDTVGKFFPGFPKGDKITIFQLLTHTSGISDSGNISHWFEKAGLKEIKNLPENYFQQFLDVAAEGFLTTEGVFEIMRTQPEFSFEPGAEGKWQYSNRGYVLLAKIIEKVTGMDFRDYMRQNVFIPAGMKNTFIHGGIMERESEIKNYTASYIPSGGAWRKVFNLIPATVGDGNVYTTLNDWILYEKCLNGEIPKVIGRNSLNELFKGQVKTFQSPSVHYGYGWFTNEVPGMGTVINHSGGTIGVNAFRTKNSKDNLTIVIFSTTTPFMLPTQSFWQYLYRNGIVAM